MLQVRQGAERAALADRRALRAGADPVHGLRKLQSQEAVDAAEDVTSSLQRTRQLLAQVQLCQSCHVCSICHQATASRATALL